MILSQASKLATSMFVALVLASAAIAQDTTPSNPESDPQPIERVAVVGASASAGFGIVVMKDTPIGRIPGSWTLARTLRAASGNSIVVSDLGTSMFFLSPQRTGKSLVDRALRSNPELIVAIDFLFWFCYGNRGPNNQRMHTLNERMEMLEIGLAMLDTYDGPIIVGDLPDMSGSIGRMLSRSMVPMPDDLEALNARIHEWAGNRPRVRVFPLSMVMTKLNEGEDFAIGEHRWDAETLQRALQRDQLHPTLDGQIALLQVLETMLMADEELKSRIPELDTDHERLKAKIVKTPPKVESESKSKSKSKSESESESSDSSDTKDRSFLTIPSVS